jgi:hypothetical protein
MKEGGRRGKGSHWKVPAAASSCSPAFEKKAFVNSQTANCLWFCCRAVFTS